MRKSELILPLRIYDDVFDQFRFNRNCGDYDKCEQGLNFPVNALPYFQFNRASNINTPAVFILRNVCGDDNGRAYKCVNPEEAEVFTPGPNTETYWEGFPKEHGYIFDNHVDPPFGFTETIAQLAECGGVESNISENLNADDMPNITLVTAEATLKVGFILGVGQKYRLKIVVAEMVRGPGSSFAIKAYNGTSGNLLLLQITEPGVYVVEFIAFENDVNIYFPNIQSGDYYRIKSVSATCLSAMTSAGGPFDGDMGLQESKIKSYQKADGQDVIIYCEGSTPQNYMPEPGDYYYVIRFGTAGNEVYFSEVFSLKRPEDLEQFYKLRWLNSCDVNSAIIYNENTYDTLCDVYFNELYLPAELFEPLYETEEEVEENGAKDKNLTFRRWQKTIKLEIAKSPPHLTDALTGVFLHDTIELTGPLNNQQEVRGDADVIERVTCEVSDILDNCYQAIKMLLFLPSRYTKTNCCDAAELYECNGSAASPAITLITEISPNLFMIEGTGEPGSIAQVEYSRNGAAYVSSDYAQAIVDEDGDYVIFLDTDWILPTITDLDVRVNTKTTLCGSYGTTGSQDII